MKFFRSFICFLLALLLICSSIVLQLSFSLKRDFFSESFYIQKIDKSKIYDKLEKSIDSMFSDYALKNKIPASSTTGIISALWVQTQTVTIIKGLIPYMERKSDDLPEIDTQTPMDIFNANLTKKLAEKNIPMDKVLTNGKTEFLRSFSQIPFSKPWSDLHADDMKDSLNNYRRYLPILDYAPIVSALLLILSIFLIFIATSKLILWKLWVSYSIIISGLITSMFCFFVSNSSAVSDFLVNNVNIDTTSIFPPKATLSLLTSILNGFFMDGTKYGGVMIFIGIALILLVSLFDTKKDNIFWYKHKPLH